MNHISKAIARLFVFFSLLVIILTTSCGQQAPAAPEISGTGPPPATATVTGTVPAPTATVTRTVPTRTATITSASHYARGLEYQQAENWEMAIEAFSRAIDLNPRDSDAFFERGRCYVMQGRNYDLAIADWSQVIQLDPEFMDAYLLRAYAYDDTGDYEKAIADYDRVIQLETQFAEAYYWRGLGHAWLGETENAISDLEQSLALGLDPELERNAQAGLEEFAQLLAGQIIFDGYWSGNTSQGEVIAFEIEDNAIVSNSVGFQIPGCESLSPFAFFSAGEPKDFVDGNKFSIWNSLSTDGSFATVAGTFTTSNTAIGILEISCKGGLSTSWTASKGARAARTPTPGDLEKIPQLEINSGLFSPDDGSGNFDEYTSVVAASGDWFLLRYFAEWIMPIPSGWTSVATSDGAYFVFSREENAEEYAVEIQVGLACEEAAQTSQQAVAMVEEIIISDGSNTEVLKKEVVDVNRGYLFVASKTEAQMTLLRLFIMSKSSEDCFYYLRATTDEVDWDDFYPIIQAMVENWFDLADNLLGVALPERLLGQSG